MQASQSRPKTKDQRPGRRVAAAGDNPGSRGKGRCHARRRAYIVEGRRHARRCAQEAEGCRQARHRAQEAESRCHLRHCAEEGEGHVVALRWLLRRQHRAVQGGTNAASACGAPIHGERHLQPVQGGAEEEGAKANERQGSREGGGTKEGKRQSSAPSRAQRRKPQKASRRPPPVRDSPPAKANKGANHFDGPFPPPPSQRR